MEKDVGAVIAHNEVRPRVYRSKYDADSQQQRIILEIGVLLALLGVNRVPVDVAEQPVIRQLNTGMAHGYDDSERSARTGRNYRGLTS